MEPDGEAGRPQPAHRHEDDRCARLTRRARGNDIGGRLDAEERHLDALVRPLVGEHLDDATGVERIAHALEHALAARDLLVEAVGVAMVRDEFEHERVVRVLQHLRALQAEIGERDLEQFPIGEMSADKEHAPAPGARGVDMLDTLEREPRIVSARERLEMQRFAEHAADILAHVADVRISVAVGQRGETARASCAGCRRYRRGAE